MNKVKTKLVLEGIEDYKKGLKQVNMGLKETRKDMEEFYIITQKLNESLRDFIELRRELV